MSNKQSTQSAEPSMVRVTAEQRKTMRGQTHRAHLIVEDKRESGLAPKRKP